MPWTRWLRPTAWLLTWRNIDDFVEETGSSPPEVQQRTGQPLNGSVEHYSRNVKRWRGGQMIQRWVASALVEAEKHFRRVRGYRDLQHLVGALDALAPPDGVVADVA